MKHQRFHPSTRRGLTRRQWLASTPVLASLGSHAVGSESPKSNLETAFFLIGDTHYLAHQEQPERLDDRSRRITTGLVNTLNRLPGKRIPDSAGGGSVSEPDGVIHAGDVIDSGDKSGKNWTRMQKTEWNAFETDFGIESGQGRLNYPTFEVHGNHDGPHGKGVAIDGMISRNRRRPGLAGISHNGLHCSWDWGAVHFINLGIVVGQTAKVEQRRRYAPMNSLDFLIRDLQQHVGDSNRPVFLNHHIDLARYCRPCDADDVDNLNREWNPCDVQAFYDAIDQYNVIAIAHGHTHVRNVMTWNGETTRADSGFSVFNVDNSSHFGGAKQACFYFEVRSAEMLVRELTTSDGWESYSWTPQVWMRPLS